MRQLSFMESVKQKIATQIPTSERQLALRNGVLSLTFDGIPRTAWTMGSVILKDHGVKATYYLNGSLCSQIVKDRQHFIRRDVESMYVTGHEIASALYDHVSVLKIPHAELIRQIDRNNQFFQEILGPVFYPQSLAYPYGDMSLAAKRICSNRFLSCRSTITGMNTGMLDVSQLKVIPLDRLFAKNIDWQELVVEAAAEKAWIIARAHAVDNSGTPFSCTPEMLDRVIRLARMAGLEILPVSTALEQAFNTSNQNVA